MAAGQWRGLEAAIKTVIFQSRAADAIKATVASEAAIATNLTHSNVVATYGHDICSATGGGGSSQPQGANELDIYKFYLFQVRTPLGPRW